MINLKAVKDCEILYFHGEPDIQKVNLREERVIDDFNCIAFKRKLDQKGSTQRGTVELDLACWLPLWLDGILRNGQGSKVLEVNVQMCPELLFRDAFVTVWYKHNNHFEN